MNVRLKGERFTQRNNGTALKPDYVKVKREFICVAEGGSLFELNESHEIHLKDDGLCVACKLWLNPTMGVWPHYEVHELDKWQKHPKRCNHAYSG